MMTIRVPHLLDLPAYILLILHIPIVYSSNDLSTYGFTSGLCQTTDATDFTTLDQSIKDNQRYCHVSEPDYTSIASGQTFTTKPHMAIWNFYPKRALKSANPEKVTIRVPNLVPITSSLNCLFTPMLKLKQATFLTNEMVECTIPPGSDVTQPKNHIFLSYDG